MRRQIARACGEVSNYNVKELPCSMTLISNTPLIHVVRFGAEVHQNVGNAQEQPDDMDDSRALFVSRSAARRYTDSQHHQHMPAIILSIRLHAEDLVAQRLASGVFDGDVFEYNVLSSRLQMMCMISVAQTTLLEPLYS